MLDKFSGDKGKKGKKGDKEEGKDDKAVEVIPVIDYGKDDFNIEVEKINRAREEMFKKTIPKVTEESKSNKTGSRKR